jgi:hypothetical protein
LLSEADTSILHAALAIRRVDASQNHCAIVYRIEGGEIRLVHLAWDRRLGNPNPESSYYWVENHIHPSLQKFIAVLCHKIAQTKPPIPYGLDSTGLAFDDQTGNLLVAPLGKGLTCSTFILCILEHYGIKLLIKEDWPADANIEWQDWVLEKLKVEAPAKHLEAMRLDKGCRRFTPEEVVASSSSETLPLGYNDARTRAEQLLSALP